MDDLLGAFVSWPPVTGCRRGEIAALRWNSFRGDVLIIGQSAYAVKGVTGIKSTKTGRDRVVHLDQSVQEWFQYWHGQCVERATEWGVHLTPESFVLSSQPDGSRFVNLDAVSRKVRKVADQLGMKSVTFIRFAISPQQSFWLEVSHPMTQPKCWATQIRR